MSDRAFRHEINDCKHDFPRVEKIISRPPKKKNIKPAMLGGCMIAGTVPKPKPPVARCSWSSVCTSSNRLAKVSAWQTTGLFWEGRQEPEWTWDRQYPAKTCDFANSVPWLYRAWGCWRNLKWRIAAVGQKPNSKKNMSLQMLLSSTSNSRSTLPKGLSAPTWQNTDGISVDWCRYQSGPRLGGKTW